MINTRFLRGKVFVFTLAAVWLDLEGQEQSTLLLVRKPGVFPSYAVEIALTVSRSTAARNRARSNDRELPGAQGSTVHFPAPLLTRGVTLSSALPRASLSPMDSRETNPWFPLRFIYVEDNVHREVVLFRVEMPHT